MKHFIYKTTNIINGKYYIGAHSTQNEDDNYLGSGTLLKKSIEKHGRENFVREILFYCVDINELYLKEIEVISEHLDNNMCYNVKPGGKGGWYSVNTSQINRGSNNVMNRCPELKRKIIENARLTRLKNKEYYDNISRNNGLKAKEKCTGVKCPSKGDSERVKRQWKENYENMRNSLSNFFEVIDPHGNKHITNRLEDFCKENNLTYTALWNTSRTNKQVKKGKTKGWICKKISQP